MAISMSSKARQEMLDSIRKQYKGSDWKTKNQLLDGFVAATGYDRKHAIKLLNAETYNSESKTQKNRGRRPYYDHTVAAVLEMIWYASNQICSKRIVPFLPELVSALERHDHLHISDEIKSRVLTISAATFDRLLRKERIKIYKGISTTRPGALLKNQIKVRTFSDWNEECPVDALFSTCF